MPAAPHSLSQRFPFTAMGCTAEIRIGGLPPARSRRIARAAMAEVRRIEAHLSRYRPASLVSRINAAAGREPVSVDEETAALLDYAATCWRESRGRFDITSGVLRRAWNFRGGALPTPEAVAALLPLIGWDKVVWERPRLFLPEAGMEIDLGGIGKEYAADRAAACCVTEGAVHALINLGGDIRVTGPQSDGSPWIIGITHPRAPETCLHDIALSAGGLATSGDYARCILVNNQPYGHLLDPGTGWPVQGLQTVTVVAPLCLVAGSLATLAMLSDETAAKTMLDTAGLPFLWVDREGRRGGTLALSPVGAIRTEENPENFPRTESKAV